MAQAGSSVTARSRVVPAPYGQACTNCAKAKYRCIYSSEHPGCERCHRLDKECIQSLSMRRRGAKRGATGSRAVNLEEKIEDLMALLRSQTAEKAAASAPTNLRTPASSGDAPAGRRPAGDEETVGSPGESGGEDGINTGRSSLALVDSVDLAAEGAQQSPLPHPVDNAPSLTSLFEPRPHQAEECFAYFRTRLLPLFPFMQLRDEMTARQLREWYPFLWINIMAITAKHVARQEVSLTGNIKRFVAQKVVVDNEASLDLLFGLLVFICWFHYHHEGKSYLPVMLSLASSIIDELGLNKFTLETTNATTPCNNNEKEQHQSQQQPTPPQTLIKTMTERRVILAYYILVSQISYAQKKIDPLDWSPYLDECLQIVSQSPEWPGDEQLAAQAKMQLIVDQVNGDPWRNQELQATNSFVGNAQSQIKRLKAQLPKSLEQNDNITVQLLYVELIVQNAILTKTPTPLYGPNYQRHQLLETHLMTISRSFNLFFSLAPTQYPAVTFMRWCQMAHCLILLHRLYVLNDPSWAWDKNNPRERVDLFALCERLSGVLGEVGASRGDGAGGPQRENMFLRFSQMIRSLSSAWWDELQSMERRQVMEDYRHQQWPSQGQWPASSSSADTPYSGMMGSGGGSVGGSVGTGNGDMMNSTAGSRPVPSWSTNMPEYAWLNNILNVSWI